MSEISVRRIKRAKRYFVSISKLVLLIAAFRLVVALVFWDGSKLAGALLWIPVGILIFGGIAFLVGYTIPMKEVGSAPAGSRSDNNGGYAGLPSMPTQPIVSESRVWPYLTIVGIALAFFIGIIFSRWMAGSPEPSQLPPDEVSSQSPSTPPVPSDRAAENVVQSIEQNSIDHPPVKQSNIGVQKPQSIPQFMMPASPEKNSVGANDKKRFEEKLVCTVMDENGKQASKSVIETHEEEGLVTINSKNFIARFSEESIIWGEEGAFEDNYNGFYTAINRFTGDFYLSFRKLPSASTSTRIGSCEKSTERLF